MRNVTGAVAVGDDFFDRKEEMRSYWRDLETDNLLLLAARRVGKTSIMRRMAADSADRGFTTVFVDVSDCADELRLIQRLFEAILETKDGEGLWTKVEKSALGKAIKRVQKIGGGGFSVEFRPDETPWSRLGEELAGALSSLDDQWLIQIDELPVFVLKLLGTAQRPIALASASFFIGCANCGFNIRRTFDGCSRVRSASIRWLRA